MARVTAIPPSTFGIPALRTEDPRFLRGEGRYVDNVDIPGALRAVFVRSIFAHATVDSIEGLAEARAMPGVAAVFAAGDLDLPTQLAAGSVEVPGGDLERPFERPIFARERVRYVGEPVAVVLADTLAHAQDAAETIWLDATTPPGRDRRRGRGRGRRRPAVPGDRDERRDPVRPAVGRRRARRCATSSFEDGS